MYATVVKSRAPEADNELDLCVGDKVVILNQCEDGWFKGVVDDNVGIFPESCVHMLKHLFSVQVNYRYESQLADELDLREGDVVSVLDDELEDDGWWFGQLNNRVGVFPNNFVEVIESVINKPVIRKKSVHSKNCDTNSPLSFKTSFQADCLVSGIKSGKEEEKKIGENKRVNMTGVFEEEAGLSASNVKKNIESRVCEGEIGGMRRERGCMLNGRGIRGDVLESKGGRLNDGRECLIDNWVGNRQKQIGSREIGGMNNASREMIADEAEEENLKESSLKEAKGSFLTEELAKIRFNFEWFSMRHARVLSQLVDEVEGEKKERKVIEEDLHGLNVMLQQRCPIT